MGSIEEIKNNNGYTCLYTWDATSCPIIYKINDYSETNNQIKITDYDKYTYTLNEDYSSKAGLYAIDDEDTSKTGEKSYYYRGEVNNNWISFGGFYWRILRINGDGSIRMMYSGTKENHSGSGAVIANTKFNNNYQGSTYLGYMYNDDDLEIHEYPSINQNKTNNYFLYIDINPGTKYYFINEKPICNSDNKTCSFICDLEKNCKYVTWEDINNNYDKTDSMSTDSSWKYVGDYKYTCWSNAKIIDNDDGSKTISCQVTSEIKGVEAKNNIISKKEARVSYYGLFSSSYESSTINKNDSNIKKTVDNWYKKNIYDKNLESYIVNQVFCNDRSLYYGDGYSLKSSIIYKSYHRISTSHEPNLICINLNDKFTLKENSLSSVKGTTNYGNNALEYPVGLITADEVTLAGGLNSIMNSKYYLNSGYSIMTISPAFISSNNSIPNVLRISPLGYIGNTSLVSSNGARPVINLRSDVSVVSGSGTELDPYVIKQDIN